MIFTLLVYLVCVLFVSFHWKRRKEGYANEPPVYPGAWPLIGHILLLLRGRKSLFGPHWYKAYLLKLRSNISETWKLLKKAAYEIPRQGGAIRFFLGPVKVYVVCNPDDSLLVANKCLSKGRSYNMVKPWVGECLLTSDESVWKKDRKLLTPAFGSQMMDNFLDIFNNESKNVVERIASEVNRTSFDHTPYMKEYAINTISNVVLGVNFTENQKYKHKVESILEILMKRMFDPLLQVDTIYDWSHTKRMEHNCINFFHGTVDKMIKEKRLQMEQNIPAETGTKNNFLDVLFDLPATNLMSDEQLRDQLNMSMAAGFDTMSATVPAVLVMIGSHKVVQKRIHEEIREVFGDTNRDVTKVDLSRLVYLEAAIKEGMRLLTTVPIVARQLEQDVKLKDYTLYAGHICVLFLRGLNLHPLWGDDVNQFNPDRWLQSNPLSDHPAAFASFSVGRRNCIGKTYAMASMKTLFVHLIRNYTITADWKNMEFRQDAMSRPDSGHHISLRRRI